MSEKKVVGKKKKCLKKLAFCCGYSLLCILLLIGAVLILGWFKIDEILHSVLSNKLELKENSEAVELWKNPPATIYRTFYLFNVTNPNEILNGKKPILQEIGPYSYKEIMEKRNMKHPDKNTVSYTSVSTLYFDETKSKGSEFDNFTFLSLLDMGIAAKSDIANTKIFLKKTVHDYISGYKSDLLNLVALATGKRREKFGLYFEKNGSEINHYVASTGADNIYNLGKIKSWNDQTVLRYWNNSYANAINGSDGSKYPPNIKKDQILYFFNPDLCRSSSLEYLKENDIEGVKTYDFHLSPNIFSNNETLNPLYKGFCPKDDCLGTGVQSIRECRDGLPMFISLPHFLNADEKFNKSVIGLNPDSDKHDYIVSLEPMTGTTIKSNIRIQFNYHLKKNKDKLKKVKDVLLPLFWLELEIDVKPGVISKLKSLQEILPKVQRIVGDYFLIVASVIICFSVVIFGISLLREKKAQTSKDYVLVKS